MPQTLIPTFVSSCDQAQKSTLGKTEFVISFFENQLYIQFNILPLVLTFFGEPTTNVGLLIQLRADILNTIDSFRQKLIVLESQISIDS